MNFTFNTTPEIVFRRGVSAVVGSLLKAKMKRPFFLTDKGLSQAGLHTSFVVSLETAGLEPLVYDHVVADPPAIMVKSALEAAKAHGCDSVIGFGGGSSMDTAKVIAVLLAGEQALEEIYGTDQVKAGRAPLVLVPTTAGTGSEVTSVAIITTEADEKVAVVDNALYPDIAILDPDLTVGLPRHVTAATGIDAMVHAIEAYTNKNKKNPMSDTLAREALKLLSHSLVRACDKPDDMAAREQMMLGAMLAGQAFANSPVGAVHGLAYPLGGIFHIPHGLSNSLMLAPVLTYNAPEADYLYAELAQIVCPENTKGSAPSDCEAFISHLNGLIEATGVERRLSQLGISHNDLPKLAEDAMKAQRVLQNNPREMTYEAALALYSEVL